MAAAVKYSTRNQYWLMLERSLNQVTEEEGRDCSPEELLVDAKETEDVGECVCIWLGGPQVEGTAISHIFRLIQ
jgi:hypothetical protein